MGAEPQEGARASRGGRGAWRGAGGWLYNDVEVVEGGHAVEDAVAEGQVVCERSGDAKVARGIGARLMSGASEYEGRASAGVAWSPVGEQLEQRELFGGRTEDRRS